MKNNTARTNGGAMAVYTADGETLVHSCMFEGDKADENGGGVYASGKSQLSVLNTEAHNNIADKGGFLYETTTGTVVTLNGIKVSGNTAPSGGSIIWGNSTGAVLNINKNNYQDLDQEGGLDDTYWASLVANLLAVNEIEDDINEFDDYVSHKTEEVKPTQSKKPVPVDDVFDLAEHSSDGDINTTYAAFPKLDNSSNFMSQNVTSFDDINGQKVTVDTFVIQPYSPQDNPTVGEGILIYQAMQYKKAHPDKEVYIDISSYRVSVQAAVNINRNSRYFGYMRQLTGGEYDKYGFVRMSYLLVSAAKMGVHVNLIGQLDGYPTTSSEQKLKSYFTSRLNDPCDPNYVTDSVVGDYLDFNFCNWTLEGKGGTDMMHTKVCAVSNYLDMNGNEHGHAVWSSSQNLDGIRSDGANANWMLQTGTIISDHEQLYKTASNYLRLMANYCGQEDIYEFQDLVNRKSQEQAKLILSGKADSIPEDEQIIYLGSEYDDVFELYFTPFGGDTLTWDEISNPYCKYISKMNKSDDYIWFTWNAAEYSSEFPLGQQIEKKISQAFHKNRNINNKIYIVASGFGTSAYNDLVVGTDIGYKSLNSKTHGSVHNKDVQFSYSENGERQFVSLLNSMNIHSGSMCYQSNFALVIKEKSCDEGSVFFTIADQTAAGIVDHNYSDEKRQEPQGEEEGYKYIECQDCGKVVKTGVIHNDSGGWITDREATDTKKGLKHRECVACGEVLEVQEIEVVGQQVADMKKVNDRGLTPTSTTEDIKIPAVIEDVPLTYEAEIYVPRIISGRGGVIVGNYAGSNENSIVVPFVKTLFQEFIVNINGYIWPARALTC